MKVRATRTGFYNEVRRRPGDVFQLSNTSHFSKAWMEPVHNAAPERATTAQQALDLAHDRDSPLGALRRASMPVESADEPNVLFDFDPYDFDRGEQ